MPSSKSVTVLNVSSSLLLAIVLFLYPVPGTGGARNLLFLSILVVLVVTWALSRTTQHAGLMDAGKEFRQPIVLLLVLTGWLVIQTSLFGTARPESFNNLFEEWVLGGIVFSWLTWSVVRLSHGQGEDGRGNLLITLMAVAVIVHVFWLFWHQLPIWQSSGSYPYGSTPYAQRDFLSFPINFAFIILVSDLASRITLKKRVLLIPAWFSSILMFFSLAAIIAVHTRNGVLSAASVLLLLAISAGYKVWLDQRKILAITMVVIPLAMIMIIAMSTVTTDSRWAGFWETVEVSTDIESNKAWLDPGKYPYPITTSGSGVEHSAYLRIAWGTVAIEGIKKHPLGYGYGLGAFGKYIEEEYGYKGWVSSHSGILDFTLANGIPAVVLLVLFLFFLLRAGCSSFVRGDPYGLLLILMLANFFTRIVLDGHFGGFRFKMFALFMGAIFYLTARSSMSHADAN